MRDEQRVRTPHTAGDTWWYEDKKGVEIYNEKGSVCVIQWRALEFALKRGQALKHSHNKQSAKCPHFMHDRLAGMTNCGHPDRCEWVK